MIVWSFLLRLLLAAGLILNGSGYAVASVHVHAEQMQMAASGAASMATPCDAHHQAMRAAATAKTDCTSAGTDVDATTSAPPSDCCQTDACGCACVNPACVVVPTVAVMPAMPGRTGMSQAMDLDRPAPALQGEIRPPIG